jgi:DNA-binding transcriptional LysR family regulator
MAPVKMEWETRLGHRFRVRDLHILSTVIKSGGMAKAARQLAMSQPSVSAAIANLESVLGVRLLDRDTRGIEPTIYAEAILKRSVAIFDELKQTVNDVQFLADPSKGELRIGCPDTSAATVVPQMIERFSEKYPLAVLHVDNVPTFSDALPVLRSRQYDLVFARLYQPLTSVVDDLNVERLFDDPVVVVAGQQNPLARRRKVDLADLVDEPWIMAGAHTWIYARVAEAFRERGLGIPKARLVTLSWPLIAHFVFNGRHIMAYPRSVAVRHSLKVLPVNLPIRPWPLSILTLKNRTLSPVAERFMECAREVAQSRADRPYAGKKS